MVQRQELSVGIVRGHWGPIGLAAALACAGSAQAQWPKFDATANVFKFQGEAAGDKLGNRVFAIGDITYDGITDYLASARYTDFGALDAGSVYLYSGADGALIQRLDGEGAFDEFGHRCDALGDLNDDGAADFVVAAFRHDGAQVDSGRVYVYSGADRTTLYVLEGVGNEQLGHDLEIMPDVDGDGKKELLLGAYRNDESGNSAGAAYMISGASGAVLAEWHGEHAEDWFGFRVAPVGDVDEDGVCDVAVGAKHDDDGGADAGKAYVFSGATHGLIYSWVGESGGDNFGERIETAGDVDRDGWPDILISALEYSSRGAQTGKVYLYSGRNGARMNTYTGESGGGLLGDRIGTLGDVNGDGYDDFFMSAPNYSSGGLPQRGKLYVYKGAQGSSQRQSTLYTKLGESEYDHYGKTVYACGDANGNGTRDLMVGVQYANGGGNDAGRVHILNGMNGRVYCTIDGELAGDSFGYSANFGGDLNADGLPEVCFGAVSGDSGLGFERGKAYVFRTYPVYIGSDDMRVGEWASIYVTGARANELVEYYMSLTGAGAGQLVNGAGGLSLDILPPAYFAGSVRANQYGEAVLKRRGPRVQVNRIYLQAIVKRGTDGADSVKSNVYAAPIAQ